MVSGKVIVMKKFLFILCGLLFLSFSVKAEFGMILGQPSTGVVYLFNTITGEVWSCGTRACNRVAIDIDDISNEYKSKGYLYQPPQSEDNKYEN